MAKVTTTVCVCWAIIQHFWGKPPSPLEPSHYKNIHLDRFIEEDAATGWEMVGAKKQLSGEPRQNPYLTCSHFDMFSFKLLQKKLLGMCCLWPERLGITDELEPFIRKSKTATEFHLHTMKMLHFVPDSLVCGCQTCMSSHFTLLSLDQYPSRVEMTCSVIQIQQGNHSLKNACWL